MKLLVKNLFPFFILLFVVIGCNQMTEQERAEYEERKQVVEKLNKQFDLHNPLYKAATGRDFDCKFQFRMEYENNKLLIARFCESTSEFTKEKEKLAGFLTPENLTLIKSAGFEKVVLYDRREKEFIDSEMIR